MRFKTIEFTNRGPFCVNQTLELVDGLNVLEGSNGSGKTTIFDVLKQEYLKASYINPLPATLRCSLVFLDENYATRTHALYEGAMRVLSDTADSPLVDELALEVKSYLNQMIRPKLETWGKFEDSLGDFDLRRDENGNIAIVDGDQTEVNALFGAAGEKFLIALAVNLGIRKALKFNEPMVLDNNFDLLDRSILNGCHEAIRSNVRQSIYLVSKPVRERLRLASDYWLVRDEKGSSILSAK